MGLLLTEVFRALREYREAQQFIQRMPPPGDRSGHPVIVIPGYLTTDSACVSLRRFVDQLGCTALGWGQGRNHGRLDEVDRLGQYIARTAEQHGQAVTLIGWSLGGIYAREAARGSADAVAQVITLGSPFCDVLHSGYPGLVYELVKSEKEKRANADMIARAATPVPVRSTAMYSRTDGVVAWQACQEPAESERHRNAEVQSSHLGMLFNTQSLQVIADQLVGPERPGG